MKTNLENKPSSCTEYARSLYNWFRLDDGGFHGCSPTAVGRRCVGYCLYGAFCFDLTTDVSAGLVPEKESP